MEGSPPPLSSVEQLPHYPLNPGILQDFLQEYNKLSRDARVMYGFPVTWDEQTLGTMSKKEHVEFPKRVYDFLNGVKKGRTHALQMQERNRKYAKWVNKHQTTSATKDLLQRFSARSPEERAFIYRYVFDMDVPSDLAKWHFYVRWAAIEKARDTNSTDDYAQYVDSLCKALAILE